MKNLFNILAASLVTCLVLSSCGKVETPNNGTPGQKKEPRVISLAFASTRTTLGTDGYSPTFVVGDQIQVSDGTGTDVCSVKYEAAKGYYIETALEGLLTAVYPASAAEINGNNITGVLVPATQDGTFAKANICKAVQSNIESKTLTFYNQTAILRFYVDESIGVTQLTISGTGVSSSGNSITVTPSPSSSSPKYGGPDDRICYVAISATASGTTYAPLTLTSVTTTQTAYANSTVTREISSVKLKQNEMYNAFIPYYIDLGDAGKWGYCNIGAFLPEEFGLYFAWGETTGHKPNSAYTGFENDSFDDSYTPSEDAYDMTEKEGSYTHYVLKSTSVYDAAKANWNDNWRMPTVEEYMTLLGLEVPTDYPDNYHAENGCGIITNANKSLIFPIAGFGDGTFLYDCYYNTPQRSSGMYWSSSLWLDEDGGGYPWIFLFDAAGGELRNEIYEPYMGMPIRPIYVGGSSEPDEPDDDGLILEIDQYTNGWGTSN